MVQKLVSDLFDIRKGEFKISAFMFTYIFVVIGVLLIVKPTVNALFLSELGPEQLPYGFLLVAVAAIVSSILYSRLVAKYSLHKIITTSVLFSCMILILLGILLLYRRLDGWMLYFFYTWVAIYAVLSASQFWVLANLVFNMRDAKRLFGFIGSGAILGGIFGGYLTSLFAPIVGNEFMLLFAALLLFTLIPLLNVIWKSRVVQMNDFKKAKRTGISSENPYHLVKKSRHLTNLAFIVGISVLVAKLVDYLFSDYATNAISDPDELSSFFGFWFSSFNLISLGVQLFLTQRIVGIWGVGFSLLLLPLGILFGSIFFLFIPELSAIVAIKAMDGILKQSINKSAFEMLALPLPFELKKRTKSFIDVVVDSVATGIAGLILIFIIKALELDTMKITWLVLILVLLWSYMIFRVRRTYYETFKKNLSEKGITQRAVQHHESKIPTVEAISTVFKQGEEQHILFMLDKLMEVNDKRLDDEVRNLLDHPSVKVKTAAMKNLYFLNSDSMPANINALFAIGDSELTSAVMDFLLLHARNDTALIFEQFLDSSDNNIAEAALASLARESVGNFRLRNTYQLEKRLHNYIAESKQQPSAVILKAIGQSSSKQFYDHIKKALKSEDQMTRRAGIEAAGLSMEMEFVRPLIELLGDKENRNAAILAFIQYGPGVMPVLTTYVKDRKIPIETCRFIPKVISGFQMQESVGYLFELFEDVDLSVRLETVRELSWLRSKRPDIKFDRFKVVSKIFEECKLYHNTLAAMHTQIIISYKNRKKSRQEVLIEEREARATLLELLERRLDTGLERIFKLLGLKYPQQDIALAYDHLTSPKEEARLHAIDFLDNLLTGNLKRRLLPIIEEAVTDFSSEETLQRIQPKIPTEQECFELLLSISDQKLNLAVLYLIGKQADSKYLALLDKFTYHDNPKIRSFASEAQSNIRQISSS